MGASLTQLKANSNQKSNCPLLNASLNKLRDQFGSFKSICENFSIDLSEFEQIFGSNESAFVIWDTDNNGLVDSLELFSGLTIFSDSKFEDKIRFLFDLFDFNELSSITPLDIEFMLYSIIQSTFKIYSISSEIIDEEIGSYVKSQFSDENRVDISQLLKWCITSQEINEFFAIIRKEKLKVKSTQSMQTFPESEPSFDKK